MRVLLTAGLVLALSSPALADEAPRRLLRLIGEAPGAKAPAPSQFVIDAVVSPGDGDFQTILEGWFAGLGDTAAAGSIEGACVEKRCTLSTSLENATFALVGDFGEAAGPVSARYSVKADYGEDPPQQGAATLRPLVGAVPGLEPLAPPGVIDEPGLDDLLLWNHQSVAMGGRGTGDHPSSSQRQSLAEWQGANGRPATGLIFASDLAALRAAAAAEQAKARWTVLGEAAKGWSAGYPATLLPVRDGDAYASADGKTKLVVAIDPPLSSEEWDKLVDRLTEDREGISGRNYVRVNDDMELRWVENGLVTVAAYHNRDKGLARLVFTYPESLEDTWSAWDPILQRTLIVTDELSR